MGPHMLNGGERACREVRTKRRRENETVSQAADDVDHESRASDIAAHDAERLGQRALDQSEAVGHTFALSDPAATCSVEADRVNLVEVGDGTVLLRNVADGRNRPDVTVHAVDALERDDLRA